MMVDFFRRRMKVFIWLVIASFVLSTFFIAAGSMWYSDKQEAAEQAAAEQRKTETPEESELNFTDPRTAATLVFKGQSEAITEGELNRAVKNARDSNEIYRRSVTSLKSFKAMMATMILDNLVKERLVLMEAEAQKLNVSRDVDTELEKIYQKYGGKEQLLANAKVSEQDLRKDIERQIKQQRVMQSVTAGKVVTDGGVEAYYQANKAEFKAADGKGTKPLTEVRGDIQSKLKSQVNDADIADYYERHRARWKLPDRATVRHLALDPSAARWKKDAKVTDAEIVAYYKDHASDYKAPKKVKIAQIFVDPASDLCKPSGTIADADLRKAFDEKHPVEIPLSVSEIAIPMGESPDERDASKRKADEIRERLEAGESFSSVAAATTTGTLATKRGDRGLIDPSKLGEPLASTVKELAVGQISAVVESGADLHIFQVRGKSPRPEKDPKRESEFAAKQDELRKDLESQKREEAARARLAEAAIAMKSGADGKPALAFDEAARKYSQAKSAAAGGDLGIVVLGENKGNAAIDEIGAGGYVDENVTDVITELKAGETSRTVKSARGFHLIKLIEVLPSENRPLAEVRKDVEKKVADQKAEKAVADALERARREFTGDGLAKDQKKKSFEEIVKSDSDGSDAKDGGLWSEILLSSDEPPALSKAVREETFSTGGLQSKILDTLKGLDPGKLSDPVTLGRTKHLFVAEKRFPATYKPLDDRIKQEIRETLNPDVSDAELLLYFHSHKSELEQPASINMAHVLLTDAEQAKDVLEMALKGEGFDYLAKKFSRDPSSKDKGGEIKGDVAIGAIKKALEKAEPGKVFPELVKSHLGWHVIKLIGRTAAKPAEFAEVKAKIKEKLLPEKRDRVLKAWLEELENQAVVRKHL